MIITLTGFMGSGKSSVGQTLAQMLGCPFMDLDALIEKEAGQTIPRLFAQEGEAAFRRREADILAQTLRRYTGATCVLSLGGGSLCQPEAAALVRKESLCIYLRARLETLQERLSGQTDGRPMLQRHDMATLLQEREARYSETAHAIIDTDNLGIEEVAEEIILTTL